MAVCFKAWQVPSPQHKTSTINKSAFACQKAGHRWGGACLPISALLQSSKVRTGEPSMHRQVPVLSSSTKDLGKGHRKQCTVGQVIKTAHSRSTAIKTAHSKSASIKKHTVGQHPSKYAVGRQLSKQCTVGQHPSKRAHSRSTSITAAHNRSTSIKAAHGRSTAIRGPTHCFPIMSSVLAQFSPHHFPSSGCRP